jgi:hypothetical protein
VLAAAVVALGYYSLFGATEDRSPPDKSAAADKAAADKAAADKAAADKAAADKAAADKAAAERKAAADKAAADKAAEKIAAKKAGPSISPDEQRWAAIKDSNKLEDFYAFVLTFKDSPRARDAQARIRMLEGRLQSAPATAPAQTSVQIRVKGFGYVYVDGVLIGPSPPVRIVDMSAGKHRVEARNSAVQPAVVSKEIEVPKTRSVFLSFE